MRKIINFILPIILLVVGIQFTRDYFGGTSKEKRNELEQLIAEGKDTVANLKSEYEEHTIKIASVPTKTYKVQYDFKVEEKDYTGSKTLLDPPSEATIAIKYLPSNPTINAANPAAEIAALDEYEGGTSTLLIGFGLILAGVGLGIYRYKSMQSAA